jgi:GntR family transcriptional regulator
MTEAPLVRELDITLERNSPVPLYYQLAQSIEQAINTGELAPGDRLENELSLTSRLGLSRPTARQAIQELVTGTQTGSRHPSCAVAVPAYRSAQQSQ